ncbi:phosphoribosylformylglycinamidine cyclo-ligase [Helicobacter sp. MIT 99-5507]|uniref:phosphoribosylformylglycinamidine cyclo-ligase n=1 Tax=Helicobacter sp. MIT 99-5507 TaxID=152489 RepID=UPI000E1E8EA8|nr:phosphoribosylformylglycinamidine cyclo-ligase [Helicobacter sp. MIT 99-5507]RDU58078.1 phosphoribosylformylglycinamidine cyclo-ligase [Helicobacter sp. MIT 99-5507]
MDKVSYKDSGVDINEGNALVEKIKPLVKKTFDNNVIGSLGGFAGAYAIPSGFKNPVILSSTDGVGTKLKLAIDSKRLDTVGIDLVAMCVNDLICSFATPMFFLDYYATAKLDKNNAFDVIKGIADGCMQASCALIGGESAEMPGMYHGNDFDLAGFAVGIAERDDLERSAKVGDILIALPSSGIHSNGYSLVRKICFEKLNMKFDDLLDDRKLIDVLLEPTRIYVKTFNNIKDNINALAHITGGGIIENLPRVLGGFGAKIEKNKIKSQSIFNFLAKYVEENELYKTFNMGVGMILVVSKENVDFVLEKSDGFIIGKVQESNKIEII